MSLFVGRKNELALLNGLIKKQSASFVVIKGRRRIGKSRLIEEFGSHFKMYLFVGLVPTPTTTKESQIQEFVRQMQRNFNLPDVHFNDWGDVFWFLADKVKKGRAIIVFDEISWIGSKDPDFLGKLKNAWDLHFKKNDKLMLIVCGSVSAWIEKNILRSTGFVGRISSTLTLDELALNECNAFWRNHNKHLSSYEKFKVLAITGGIPKYLEEIRPELTAEQNIKDLCFQKEGYLFNEFDQIFSDVFLTRSDIYKKIVMSLVAQPLEPSEICRQIGAELNNTMTGYFDELMQAGFIKRDFTWHLKSKQASKLSHYRLKDNYVRFYLKYILPNHTKIKEGAFNDKALSVFPGWSTIMGYQFENLVLNNRKKIWEKLNISPDEIVYDNPFFQNKTIKQEGCQIDYLIQTKSSSLYVCEIKFSASELKKDITYEVDEKIRKLKRPKGFSCRSVLIHVNGVQEEVIEQDYFSHILDFGELLN